MTLLSISIHLNYAPYISVCVHSKDEVAQSENMMLKFSLRWSKGSPKYKLVSELEMALDLQRIRNGGWKGGEGG